MNLIHIFYIQDTYNDNDNGNDNSYSYHYNN